MTLKETLKKYICEEISYSDAIANLRSNIKNTDDLENLVILFDKLKKILGDNSARIVDSGIPNAQKIAFTSLPNEQRTEILKEVISMYAKGEIFENIVFFLYDKYHLDPSLISYFTGEAESIVRMNMLSDEEIDIIGQRYMKVYLDAIKRNNKSFQEVSDSIVSEEEDDKNKIF